jgi:hypothetical protein
MNKNNPLENLKEKLKIKPKVDPIKLYEITIPTKQEEVTLKKVKIVDERKKEPKFDIEKIREQMKEKRLTKVIEKDVRSSIPIEKNVKETQLPTKKKSAKSFKIFTGKNHSYKNKIKRS